MSLIDERKDIVAAVEVEIGKLDKFLTVDVKGPLASSDDNDLDLDVHYRLAFTRRGAFYLISAMAEALNMAEELDDDS